MARLGTEMCLWLSWNIRQGRHGDVWYGLVRLGKARLGKAGEVRLGVEWYVGLGYGSARYG